MSYVFISYSPVDGDYAKQYAEELQRRGFKVFFNESCRYGFQHIWRTKHNDLIRTSAAVCTVISSTALQDDNVEWDVLVAEWAKKPTFVVLTEELDFELPASIPYADATDGRLPADDFCARLAEVAPAEPPHVIDSANWLQERLGLPSDKSELDESPPPSKAPALDALDRLELALIYERSVSDTITRALGNRGVHSDSLGSVELFAAKHWMEGEFEPSVIAIPRNLLRGRWPLLSPQEQAQLFRVGRDGIGPLLFKRWELSNDPDLPREISYSIVDAGEILGYPLTKSLRSLKEGEFSRRRHKLNGDIATSLTSGIESQCQIGVLSTQIRWQIGRVSVHLNAVPDTLEQPFLEARISLHNVVQAARELLLLRGWDFPHDYAMDDYATWRVSVTARLGYLVSSLVETNLILGVSLEDIDIETTGF